MAREKNKKLNRATPEELEQNSLGKFKLTKSKIQEMYNDDTSLRNNTDSPTTSSATINSTGLDSLTTAYYNLNNMENIRKYSQESYVFYPTYAEVIDYLANMFTWDYIYTPRMVKEKAISADFDELYKLMGEVVDGLTIPTVYPSVLTKILLDGAVYLYGRKTTSSKTISLMSLPTKYCRVDSITQYGTLTYQFDYQYFDSLGVQGEELNELLAFFPEEIRAGYNTYLKDKNNMRWQRLNPKFAAAIVVNEKQFPTKLQALFALKRYDQYQDNELARSNQQLEKIIAHEMPTWEDKLIVDIDEMSELHKSISKSISKNNKSKLVTTFGKLNVLDIAKDDSRENRTLQNAHNTIYDNLGENNELFTGANEGALKYGLKRDESIMWKYVEQLTSFCNVVINNLYNFKGYQCDLQIMPITLYNRQEMLNLYRESATLGVGKLEYMVVSGTKQINIPSKIELENYLKLDQLRPLATSYTQSDNNQESRDNQEKSEKENEDEETSSSSADDKDAADEANPKQTSEEDNKEVKDANDTK